jgi:hypothetical protein
MKIKNIFLIYFFIILCLLSIALFSCNQRATDSKTEQSIDSKTEQSIQNFFKEFEKALSKVSLSDSADIVSKEIEENYSDYISKHLMQRWIEDPSVALGRLNPFPGLNSIEIIKIKENVGSYYMTGNIIDTLDSEEESRDTIEYEEYEANFLLNCPYGYWQITDAVKASGKIDIPDLDTEINSKNFFLKFEYGLGGMNVLDTFNNIFERDMVGDPSAIISFHLTDDDLNRIYKKMIEIDFFNYPEIFFIDVSSEPEIGTVTPNYTYYFKVEINSQVKELSWDDYITNENKKADELRSLIDLIRDIIYSKDAYKALPEPEGAYE